MRLNLFYIIPQVVLVNVSILKVLEVHLEHTSRE